METTPEAVVRQQVEQLCSLSGVQLQQWLLQRLAGRDPILPDEPEFDAAYPVLAIAPHLPASAVVQLQHAAIRILSEWIANKALPTDQLDILLLIIQGLRAAPAGLLLESFARSEVFASVARPLQTRMIQTLVALELNLEPRFWYGILAMDPEHFASLAFNGLALVSPSHAIELLTKIPDSERVGRSISMSLPGFMDDIVPARSRAAVRSLIASRIERFSTAVAEAVQDFFANEETPVTVMTLIRNWRADFKLLDRNAYPALANRLENEQQAPPSFRNMNPARVLVELACQ